MYMHFRAHHGAFSQQIFRVTGDERARHFEGLGYGSSRFLFWFCYISVTVTFVMGGTVRRDMPPLWKCKHTVLRDGISAQYAAQWLLRNSWKVCPSNRTAQSVESVGVVFTKYVQWVFLGFCACACESTASLYTPFSFSIDSISVFPVYPLDQLLQPGFRLSC